MKGKGCGERAVKILVSRVEKTSQEKRIWLKMRERLIDMEMLPERRAIGLILNRQRANIFFKLLETLHRIDLAKSN